MWGAWCNRFLFSFLRFPFAAGKISCVSHVLDGTDDSIPPPLKHGDLFCLIVEENHARGNPCNTAATSPCANSWDCPVGEPGGRSATTSSVLWVPGVELRPLCLPGTHFTDWAICPAPQALRSQTVAYCKENVWLCAQGFSFKKKKILIGALETQTGNWLASHQKHVLRKYIVM